MQMTFDKGNMIDTSLSASFISALACGEGEPDLCDSQECYKHLCGSTDPCTTECTSGGMTGTSCSVYNTCL